LSFVPNAGASKILDHKRMEVLATEIAGEFRAHARKLSLLRPSIELIRAYFRTNVRGSVTLADCRNFKEYCEKQLHRTEQAVYAMLGGYSKKQKEKKQRVPKVEREYDDHLSQEVVARMRTALNAVQRATQAKTEDERDAAWREYARIAEAEPLKSVIDGDHPSYKVLLLDVLAAARQIEAGAVQMHDVLTRIMESGILADDPSLLASVESTMTRAEELLSAGKSLTALRKRLSIGEPGHELSAG
jgi:hypothetical protein